MYSILHKLKIWPVFFSDVETGQKTFEIRKNDRNFLAGDLLQLQEWEPLEKKYTGKSLFAVITYVTSFGQPDGQVVMAIKLIKESEIS